MNYKAKAQEIYSKYLASVIQRGPDISAYIGTLDIEQYADYSEEQKEWNHNKAKECSIICVDEILNSEFNGSSKYNYFLKVKEEIKKLEWIS